MDRGLPLFLSGGRARRAVISPTGFRYAATIAGGGRYLLDQYGSAYLVRGTSYWGACSLISSADFTTLCQHLAAIGTNSMIFSLIGAAGIGGTDNAQTFDGVSPFVAGNPTNWNATYWARMDAMVTAARDNGITLWLMPFEHYGYASSGPVGGISTGTAQTFGTMVANRYPASTYPNVIWFFGNDYSPNGTEDNVWDALLTGIRSTGDTRPMTIMLTSSNSTDYTFWEQRAQINCEYRYAPQYWGALDNYQRTPGARDPRPGLFMEARYEGDTWFVISGEPSPNTPWMRTQEMWALTSGSYGAFYGNNDWRFASGWQGRLSSWTGETQIGKLRTWFDTLPWTGLVPDDLAHIVTSGRGTKVTSPTADDYAWTNDYVTAAYNAAGTCAVIYIPTNATNSSRTITVDLTKMGASGRVYKWVDPTDATSTSTATPSGSDFTTPAAHADGTRDWALWLKAD